MQLNCKYMFLNGISTCPPVTPMMCVSMCTATSQCNMSACNSHDVCITIYSYKPVQHVHMLHPRCVHWPYRWLRMSVWSGIHGKIVWNRYFKKTVSVTTRLSPSLLVCLRHHSSISVTTHLYPSPLVYSRHHSSISVTTRLSPSRLVYHRHHSSVSVTTRLSPSSLVYLRHHSSISVTTCLSPSPLVFLRHPSISII
jgi:hypothetical protein